MAPATWSYRGREHQRHRRRLCARRRSYTRAGPSSSARAARCSARTPTGSTCSCTTSRPGSWFWHLRRHPAYDYAAALARRRDRRWCSTGSGTAPARCPTATRPASAPRPTCSTRWSSTCARGCYRFAGSRRATPAAHHVVLHGHAVGAAIAELEAATYDDVDGLVLMSWTDRRRHPAGRDEARPAVAPLPAGAGLRALRRQRPRDYRSPALPHGPGRRPARAPRPTAAPPRCGDVLSLGSALAATGRGPRAARRGAGAAALRWPRPPEPRRRRAPAGAALRLVGPGPSARRAGAPATRCRSSAPRPPPAPGCCTGSPPSADPGGRGGRAGSVRRPSGRRASRRRPPRGRGRRSRAGSRPSRASGAGRPGRAACRIAPPDHDQHGLAAVLVGDLLEDGLTRATTSEIRSPPSMAADSSPSTQARKTPSK